jgi:hypothetical protein
MQRKLAITSSLFLLVATLFPVTSSIATADSTWISRTSLSSVSLVAPAAKKNGYNTSLSTQTTTVALTYKGSASDAGKFAQINLFEVSQGLTISMTGTPKASSSGCEQQVLNGDSHSCMFALDGSGNAAIQLTLSGVSISSSFKYILLSGPNMSQTNPAIVSFAAPRSSIKAVSASVKGSLGGAAIVRFKITEDNVAVADMKVTMSFKGSGENPSALTLTSDSKGQVFFFLSNLSSKKPNTTVTATIQGTNIKANATVIWVKNG